MATKSATPKLEGREKLLMTYLTAKQALDAAEAECKVAQQALKDDLGELTETFCGPFKLVYRPNTEIDEARLKLEKPSEYKKCATKFNVTLFRSMFPELVEIYERESKTRPLKVVAV